MSRRLSDVRVCCSRHQQFDKALRAYLGAFRLPGEAAQIDRVVQHFSERFAKDNPAVFAVWIISR